MPHLSISNCTCLSASISHLPFLCMPLPHQSSSIPPLFRSFLPLSPCLSPFRALFLSLSLSTYFLHVFYLFIPTTVECLNDTPRLYPLFTWKFVHVSIMSNAVTNCFAEKLRNNINGICISL